MAQSVTENPRNVRALNDLANILKDQRCFEQAIQCYRAAISICPRESLLHC
jgi:hypothetical protein